MSNLAVAGSQAWSWFSAGVILLILEMMTPGLVFIFFGLAALVMAALVAFWPGFPPVWQMVAFAALSVLFVVGLRRAFKRVFTGKKQAQSNNGLADEFAGHRATVSVALDGERPGRVAFNGTDWSAVSDKPIPVGAVVEILSHENLTLSVRQVIKQP